MLASFTKKNKSVKFAHPTKTLQLVFQNHECNQKSFDKNFLSHLGDAEKPVCNKIMFWLKEKRCEFQKSLFFPAQCKATSLVTLNL